MQAYLFSLNVIQGNFLSGHYEMKELKFRKQFLHSILIINVNLQVQKNKGKLFLVILISKHFCVLPE